MTVISLENSKTLDAVGMNAAAAEAYELFIDQEDLSASVWIYLHTNKQLMNY